MTEINITSLMIIALAVFTIWTMDKRHAAEIRMFKGMIELCEAQNKILTWMLDKRIPYINQNGKFIVKTSKDTL